MTTAADRVNERYACGFNCAQSVFAAFAGEDISSDVALRLAASFGGGIGRSGQVCGALTGALMALGLQRATGQPADKERIYQLTRDFMHQFERQHGTVLCRDLLGFDISTPEGLQAARDNGAFGRVCPSVVAWTARALERCLASHPQP